jgi:CRISPR-associated protein Cmr2
VPDHSIWDHLDLTSAFAGPLAGDANGECALLSVSLGPVQDFIAAARTASDLWAGSHLLSRMAWEAMKVVAERFGPDAILFPRLRGVALVDLWLAEDIRLPKALFKDQSWSRHTSTDANPLFAAALPNRFLAVVPAEQAQALAKEITGHVRRWAHTQARAAFDKLREAAGGNRGSAHAKGQIDEQLAGFPEVHWAVAPYNRLIGLEDEKSQKVTDTEALRQCLAPFFRNTDAPAFLGSAVWRLLSQTIDVDGARFYQPNPGVLYPAVHELADRAQAAAKTARPFAALAQTGYRCSLTGTAEWLTDDAEQLHWPPGERNANGTLWTEVADAKPAWARKGEHLGALATLKRLWPTLFVDEIENALDERPSRFVVSTHAMALAPTLARLGREPLNMDDDLRAKIQQCDRAALPRRLVTRHLSGHPDGDLIARIPDWLDRKRKSGDEDKAESAERDISRALGEAPEAYYALVLMDGDHMGSWLAGDSEHAITYKASFHPELRQSLDNRFNHNTALQNYLKTRRALSPSRHLAISGALGDFSSAIARRIVEEDHMGRLLYAGGDDLMAMVTVSDLLPMMAALRGAYAGQPLDPQAENQAGRFASGFYHRGKRLYMTMGEKATASIGAVIAHHQAPLGHVQRALKAAEQRAKKEGERNAFSIQIIKRSGGTVTLTLPWAADSRETGQSSHIRCLQELSAEFVRDTCASRRAAYNVHDWLHGLPEPQAVGGKDAYRAMVAALLHQQFERQGLEDDKDATHSRRLARLIRVENAHADATLLENFLSLAEFLARECRSAS